EGELVVVRLDQDRAQRGLHRGAVTDRQVPQAVHRVDPLGERDRDADLAQLGDHAFYGGEHGPAFLGVSRMEAVTATIVTRLTRAAAGPGMSGHAVGEEGFPPSVRNQGAGTTADGERPAW